MGLFFHRSSSASLSPLPHYSCRLGSLAERSALETPRRQPVDGLLNYSRIFANDAFWFPDEKHVSLCFNGRSKWYGPIFLNPAVLIFSLRYNSLRQFFEAAFYLPGMISG